MGPAEMAVQSTGAIEKSGVLVESGQIIPSYKERAAFITSLKKKWMLQRGYCSVFDRARERRLDQEKTQVKRQDLEERRRVKKQIIAALLRAGLEG